MNPKIDFRTILNPKDNKGMTRLEYQIDFPQGEDHEGIQQAVWHYAKYLIDYQNDIRRKIVLRQKP